MTDAPRSTARRPPSDERALAATRSPTARHPRLRVNFIASLDGAATRDGLSGGLEQRRRPTADFDTAPHADRRDRGRRRHGAGRGLRRSEARRRTRPGGVAHGLPRAAGARDRLVAARARPGASVLQPRPSVRPLVLTHAAAPAARRAALAEVADVIDLRRGMPSSRPRLRRRARASAGCRRCSARADRTSSATLLAADCVDELCLSLSPVLESRRRGPDRAGRAPKPRGRCASCTRCRPATCCSCATPALADTCQ